MYCDILGRGSDGKESVHTNINKLGLKGEKNLNMYELLHHHEC